MAEPNCIEEERCIFSKVEVGLGDQSMGGRMPLPFLCQSALIFEIRDTISPLASPFNHGVHQIMLRKFSEVRGYSVIIGFDHGLPPIASEDGTASRKLGCQRNLLYTYHGRFQEQESWNDNHCDPRVPSRAYIVGCFVLRF